MHTVIWDLTDRLSRYKYVPIAPITHHAGTSRSLVRVTDREALGLVCTRSLDDGPHTKAINIPRLKAKDYLACRAILTSSAAVESMDSEGSAAIESMDSLKFYLVVCVLPKLLLQPSLGNRIGVKARASSFYLSRAQEVWLRVLQVLVDLCRGKSDVIRYARP